MNKLFYGDNLNILREYIKDETVDLIYLDPPFNSNRNYNVLFKSESGTEAESQITAFEDTWHWNASAEETYRELILEGDNVGQMVESFRQFIGANQMMAYLVMMAIRLKELHRVLKPTGSLYLHCDPTASHYLKILLDTVFGAQNFRNEIVWKRSSAHNDRSQGNVIHFGRIHDVILFYTRSNNATRNDVYTPYSDSYLKSFYKYSDEKGRYQLDNIAGPGGAAKGNPEYEFLGVTRYWRYSRERMQELYDKGLIIQTKPGTVPRFKRYLDESKGVPMQDIIDDINPLQSSTAERLGYPTQKPVALLERILKASSNEGDLVLDPFCGCGTTIAAAQNLNRQWIGIDITHLAVGLQKLRLKDTFGMLPLSEKPKGSASASPKGTEKIARGKAEGRNPGDTPTTGADPEGVAQTDTAVAPLQGADDLGDSNPAFHTGLLNPSPSATSKYYQVIGQPEDLAGAKNLAENDRYGFQWWVLPLIGARAAGAEKGKREGKKGSDKGIDGTMTFIDDTSGKTKRVIISVKSGKVNVAHIRDLVGTIEREKAAIGVYVTLEPPTKPMITEAVSAGFYHSEFFGKDYPRIQILTVEDILAGKTVNMPSESVAFKKAEKEGFSHKQQPSIFDTEE